MTVSNTYYSTLLQYTVKKVYVIDSDSVVEELLYLFSHDHNHNYCFIFGHAGSCTTGFQLRKSFNGFGL